MSSSRFTYLLSGVLMAGAVVMSGERAAYAQSTAVLELFTSQGCSSCPPADALMEHFRARSDVIALTLPVDYWDYLGWKDTLANPANSKRQRDYALARRDRAVYTPQIVINGMIHAVGSNRKAVEAAIAESSAALTNEVVPVSIDATADTLDVSIGAAADNAKTRKGTIWLILFNGREEVIIQRGENAGRTITYFNVVKEMIPVGMWDGDQASMRLPRRELKARGHGGSAVLLQAGEAGAIIGAAQITGL